MDYIIHWHVNTLFNSLSYRIGNILIDPGDEWDGFRYVKAVLLTHAHFDHIYGLNRVLQLNPDAKVYTNERGKIMLFNDRLNMSRFHETPFIFEFPDNIVEISQQFMIIEDLAVDIYETPGHNPSCLTFRIGDCIFTGDAYIPGVKTVTNLPNGNKQLSLESEKLILKLSETSEIFPGHKIM